MNQWRSLFNTVDTFGAISGERQLDACELLMYQQACRALQTLLKMLDSAWEREYQQDREQHGDPTEYRNGPEDVGPPEGESKK